MSDCSKGWGNRCTKAQTKRCRCACGGVNHGAQLRLRLDRDDEPPVEVDDFDVAVAKYLATGPLP